MAWPILENRESQLRTDRAGAQDVKPTIALQRASWRPGATVSALHQQLRRSDMPRRSLIGWIRDQAEHYGKLVSNYRAVGIVPPQSR